MGQEGRGRRERLSGSLRSQDPSSPFCRAAFKNLGLGQFFPRVSALCGSSLASGAVDHVRGTALRVCVYFLSPRRSLASSLQTAPCGFNAFHPSALSRPTRVTAQILPSALRGDVTQCGDGPARTSPHTHGAECSPQKGRCVQSPRCSCEDRTGHLAPHSLQTGVEGIVFVITFQYVTVSLFILLLRGLERIHEYQTKTCSPGELCPGPCNARAGRDPRHHLA